MTSGDALKSYAAGVGNAVGNAIIDGVNLVGGGFTGMPGQVPSVDFEAKSKIYEAQGEASAEGLMAANAGRALGKGLTELTTVRLAGGAERAAQFGANWPTASLDDALSTFAGSNPLISTTAKGKKIFNKPKYRNSSCSGCKR